MAEGYVEYRNLRKSFGGLEILHGVDLTIPEGAFAVLVGPSGCGKSTLLRMTAGLEDVTSGEINIAGRVVNKVHAKNRGIAMVFQSYALYPHMSVEDNMSFGLKMRKTPLQLITDRIKRATAILKLGPMLDRLPSQLSGGQRQRVAMGRALTREPEVFLFDEPLSNLDAKLRVEMRAEIKALHQRLKTTTIYVTHDQIEAMTMADVVVVMHDGRIEQVGEPLAIYDRPANLFVAEFLGSPAMNLIRGTIAEEGGTRIVKTDSGLRLPLPPEANGTIGQAVVYGVRPEHLQIDPAGDQTLQLTLVEPAGWETHVHADLGGQIVRMVSTARVHQRAGDTTTARIDATRVHLFDAASGMRL
ncbi:MAG: ABC transporter ATP-binding protein [Paracoccaceae bacterium]